MAVTIELLKNHIHFEEGMEETMLSVFLESARKYVLTATGSTDDYCILLVAGIMYEYRIAEKQLEEALNAITPFLVQSVFSEVFDVEKNLIE